MSLSPKNLYGIVAVAETVTWTGLIAAMIARYGFNTDGPWFFVAGISHGTVFLAYCTVAVLVGWNQRWSLGRVLVALLTAIPPYATIPFDRALVTRQLLEGPWRTTAGDDPRDLRFPDRLLRWFIARPVALIVAILAVVALLVTLALSLGSPTEWGGR